ncbi:hypothetical protein Cyrtocomes_00993 [Candidatus Cyrtobacter comes]|uniref:Uncharacterized protein n=1 Tax=Candidatus Cyrtobacter comes TaxID=675776 RepID=A0ABU5L901_9RICK|nr:hypothetical protein [Candidatus Cyrtobacter comes]MDZ5762602.1 hypothetical protein [Candidatus Cyrtobacter comes]
MRFHLHGCLLTIIKSDDVVLRFSSGGAHSLGNFRRLSKVYEITTSSANAFTELAKIMMKNLSKSLLVLRIEWYVGCSAMDIAKRIIENGIRAKNTQLATG